MDDTSRDEAERDLRHPPQQLRLQQQLSMQQQLCSYFLAGNCKQGRKCRMVHLRSPSPDGCTEPADEQLYEAVSWLEATVRAAQARGASSEALASAQMRLQCATSRLAVMLLERTAQATKGKPRAPKAHRGGRKGRSKYGTHGKPGLPTKKKQRLATPASASSDPPHLPRSKDCKVEDCGEDGIYIWGSDDEVDSPDWSAPDDRGEDGIINWHMDGAANPPEQCQGAAALVPPSAPEDNGCEIVQMARREGRNPYLDAGSAPNPYADDKRG